MSLIVTMISSLAFTQPSGLIKIAILKALPREKNYIGFVKSMFIKLIGDIKQAEIICRLSSV